MLNQELAKRAAAFITNDMTGAIKDKTGMELHDYLRFGKLETLEGAKLLLSCTEKRIAEWDHKSYGPEYGHLLMYRNDLKRIMNKKFGTARF